MLNVHRKRRPALAVLEERPQEADIERMTQHPSTHPRPPPRRPQRAPCYNIVITNLTTGDVLWTLSSTAGMSVKEVHLAHHNM